MSKIIINYWREADYSVSQSNLIRKWSGKNQVRNFDKYCQDLCSCLTVFSLSFLWTCQCQKRIYSLCDYLFRTRWNFSSNLNLKISSIPNESMIMKLYWKIFILSSTSFHQIFIDFLWIFTVGIYKISFLRRWKQHSDLRALTSHSLSKVFCRFK